MIGVVIGSYGMPSAVRLNVSAIRHYNKERIPILVHDDATPFERDHDGYLRLPNSEFEIIRAERQHGHIAGDVQCFTKGLEWAKNKGLKYLVKLSQRFIFTTEEWCSKAVKYATDEDVITASQKANHGAIAPWGSICMRTECVLFRVNDWARDDVYQAIIDYHATPELSMRDVAEKIVHPGRSMDRWRVFDPDKARKRKGVLWHDANSEEEYVQLAKEIGCPFGWYTNLGWPMLLGKDYKMS